MVALMLLGLSSLKDCKVSNLVLPFDVHDWLKPLLLKALLFLEVLSVQGSCFGSAELSWNDKSFLLKDKEKQCMVIHHWRHATKTLLTFRMRLQFSFSFSLIKVGGTACPSTSVTYTFIFWNQVLHRNQIKATFGEHVFHETQSSAHKLASA